MFRVRTVATIVVLSSLVAVAVKVLPQHKDKLAGMAQQILHPPPPAAPKPPPPPDVTITMPIERDVTEFLEFPGRTAPVETVEVRARVGGFLQKVNFKDGASVNQGDLLFEIDPATYKAAVAQTEGTLASANAKLKTQELELKRYRALVSRAAISQEQLDQTIGAVAETNATIQALQAAVDRTKLDLEYTKVTAPITGLIGRARVTPGNVVTANQTLLTTIVSVDPIYAYFEIDESTVLRARKLIREREIQDYRIAKLPVAINLAGEKDFPHKGMIDFAENALDAGTGTLTARGVFPNKDRAMSGGMFVRVKFPLGGPKPAILIPDRAMSVDQRGEFLKIVGEGDIVEDRLITTGHVENGLVIVETGLKAGERVVVRGLQRARSGAKVNITETERAAAAVVSRTNLGTGAGMEGGPKSK